MESIEQGIEDVFPDALAQHWYQIFTANPKHLEREYAGLLNYSN